MKIKFLMMAALCAMGFVTHAQIQKGATIGGLSLSFGTTDQNSNATRLNSFAINPRIGYFLNNNLSLGMEFNYNISKLDGEFYDYFDTSTNSIQSSFGFKEENFGLSPFARYYIHIKENFKFFGQANLTFQINSYKNIDDTGYLYRTDYTFKGFGASLNPGFAFLPSGKWDIELSFPLISYFNERGNNQDYHFSRSSNVQLVLDNFTPSFGVNFHF
ncbi:MAG: porin family protein [Pedobacter sp.]|nr:MAG: porin family protein [Pedobacter sp.]